METIYHEVCFILIIFFKSGCGEKTFSSTKRLISHFWKDHQHQTKVVYFARRYRSWVGVYSWATKMWGGFGGPKNKKEGWRLNSVKEISGGLTFGITIPGGGGGVIRNWGSCRVAFIIFSVEKQKVVHIFILKLCKCRKKTPNLKPASFQKKNAHPLFNWKIDMWEMLNF
jgi:hypothetical protein